MNSIHQFNLIVDVVFLFKIYQRNTPSLENGFQLNFKNSHIGKITTGCVLIKMFDEDDKF